MIPVKITRFFQQKKTEKSKNPPHLHLRRSALGAHLATFPWTVALKTVGEPTAETNEVPSWELRDLLSARIVGDDFSAFQRCDMLVS